MRFGVLYQRGLGVERNEAEAVKWFPLDTSKYTALEERDRLMALITSAQIAEAKRLAREWRPPPVETIERQAN
jgi:hypothetical protein